MSASIIRQKQKREVMGKIGAARSRSPTKEVASAPARGGRSRRTLVRVDLANAVGAICPRFSRRQAGQLVDEVLEEIILALCAGETVRLHKFGSFKVSERRLAPPGTDGVAEIMSRRVLRFRPSHCLLSLTAEKQALDGGGDRDNQP